MFFGKTFLKKIRLLKEKNLGELLKFRKKENIEVNSTMSEKKLNLQREPFNHQNA